MGHFLVVVVIRFALDSAVDLSTESTRISQTRCGMAPPLALDDDGSPLRLESVPGEVSQLPKGDTSIPLGARFPPSDVILPRRFGGEG